MAARTTKGAWLTAFLWINLMAWSIALGGKLFEFVVVIPAWAANPPASLSLMPYGPRYPFDPGDFYQPLGVWFDVFRTALTLPVLVCIARAISRNGGMDGAT